MDAELEAIPAHARTVFSYFWSKRGETEKFVLQTLQSKYGKCPPNLKSVSSEERAKIAKDIEKEIFELLSEMKYDENMVKMEIESWMANEYARQRGLILCDAENW